MTPQQFDIIYRALQQYVNRISVVQQAVRDLRPVMFTPLPPNTATEQEIVEYCTQLDRVPQIGIWHDDEQTEWKYFFHGIGLRITNRLTREPIDWDLHITSQSFLKIFEKFFFQEWFEWFVSTDPSLVEEFPKEKIYDLVKKAFKEMEIKELIVAVEGGHKLNVQS